MTKAQFFLTFVFLTALICYAQSQTAVCPEPRDPENAFSTSDEKVSYTIGATVKYECRLGYGLTGVGNTRECLANSSWSEPQFSCMKQDCRLPPDVRNGQYILSTGNTLFGTKATYTCNTGFMLSSSSKEITCSVRDSENSVYWRGTTPTCDYVVCGPIDAPVNGNFNDGGLSEYRYGTSVTFSCNSGFILSSESLKTVTCDASGSWGEFPTCEVNYGCDFEDRPPAFPCGYTNNQWMRVFVTDYRGRKGFVAEMKERSGGSLTSQSFTIGDQGACLSFYYKILDNNAAEFSVTQRRSDGSGSPKTLFSASQVTDWQQTQLNLVADGSITWKFEVSAATTADIQLDFVQLQHVACRSPTTTTTPNEENTTGTATASSPNLATTIISLLGIFTAYFSI